MQLNGSCEHTILQEPRRSTDKRRTPLKLQYV